MKLFTRIAIVALAALTTSSALHAQVDYNRKASKISVQPNKDGSHRITGFWEYQFDTTLAVDLTTTASLLVNGNVLWDGHVTVLKIADQGGGGACPQPNCPGATNCGFAVQNGVGVELTCYQSYLTMGGTPIIPLEPVCSCSGPVCEVMADFDQLNPGDVIELILHPADAGWTEIDTSDDAISMTYTGELDRWNRRIANVDIRPRAGGPTGFGDSFFDVWVDVEFQSTGTGFINASAELELFINGSSVDTKAAFGYYTNDGVCTGAGCPANLCGEWTEFGTMNGTCVQSTYTIGNNPPTHYCHCNSPNPTGPIVFPNLDIQPTDEIMVILRPVPGALPELPPLPGTDEEGDDSATGRLPNDCPCEGDANGDGVVDVNDISYVLFRLGNLCFPV